MSNKFPHILGAEVSKAIFERWPNFKREIQDLPHPIKTEKFHKKVERVLDLPDMGSAVREVAENLTFTQYRSAFPTGINERSAMDLAYFLAKDPKIFSISEGLGEFLKRTSLKGATYEFLKVPFEVTYLQLPKNDFSVWYNNPTGGEERGDLDGVYCYIEESDEEVHGPGKLAVFLCVSKSEVPLDDCLFTSPIFFSEGGDVEEDLDRATSRQLHAYRAKQEADRLNIEQFKNVFSWVINCLLYINSADAELRKEWLHQGLAKKVKKAKGSRKTKLKRQLRETSSEIIVVGRSISIGQPTVVVSVENDGEGRKSPRAHWVHGFWRQTPHGPGRTLRRLKWIKPFLRGVGADVLRKMYKVE